MVKPIKLAFICKTCGLRPIEWGMLNASFIIKEIQNYELSTTRELIRETVRQNFNLTEASAALYTLSQASVSTSKT